MINYNSQSITGTVDNILWDQHPWRWCPLLVS